MSEFALVILLISTRDVDGSLQHIFLLFCYLRIITWSRDFDIYGDSSSKGPFNVYVK